jgi:pSer/pThr/pTyr-binding forkhead associated (FHA) protein
MFTERRLEHYFDDLRRLSREQFQIHHPNAVLLCRAEKAGGGEGAEFVTRLVPQNEQGGLDSLAIHPSLGVIELCKRPGGGFSERIGVGRTRNSDIVLPYGRISKLHAFFTKSEDETRYYLTDAGSKNGTFLDGTQLEARSTVELHEGAIVRFAEETFRFHTPGGLYDVLQRLR